MNAEQILNELKNEFVSTRTLLERVPKDRLNFKPHEKAMPLGQLAFHVAEVTGRMLTIGKDQQIEVDVLVNHPIPTSKEEILQQFEKSTTIINKILINSDNTWLEKTWKLLKDGKVIAELPMLNYIRTFVLNHFIHHRGELVTYLRQLNQLIPSIYGPSADENPFV